MGLFYVGKMMESFFYQNLINFKPEKLFTMKSAFISASIVILLFTSCGPAAEDRFQMDRLAKRMSDSLATLVDSGLNDPLKHINFVQSPPPSAPVADTIKPANQAGK